MSLHVSKINIVTCADDQYSMPLAVALRSALVNLRTQAEVRIFIIDGGIRALNRKNIQKSLKNVRVTWLKPRRNRLRGLAPYGHLSVATYLRLFIPELLPQSFEKAIYIDSDTVVLANLETLWSIPIKKHYILAVPDAYFKRVRDRINRVAYRGYAISSSAKYFNAGVMVINMSAWRRDHITDAIVRIVPKNTRSLLQHDQDAMNIVLQDKWGELDVRWNQQRFHHQQGFRQENSLAKEKHDNLIRAPYIIHFSSPYKPWMNPWDDHPGKKIFFNYLDKTFWKGWRPTIKEVLWGRIQSGRKKI